MTHQDFISHIWNYYQEHKRDFVWRNTTNPYHIVVSEIMLQQTQTHRVMQKFPEFITKFPDIFSLADASFKDVLQLWQGLGYNRRALALHKIAHLVTQNFSGEIPQNPEILIAFPGIGPNTAGSIIAFAFNKPVVFIETNIRSVFIHFFFKNQEKVHDNDIIPLIAQTVDKTKPREWYYALMDYGSMLKKSISNPNRASKHYTKQSKFEGSDRQIRGLILKILTQENKITQQELFMRINKDIHRVNKALAELLQEGFVQQDQDTLSIT